MSRIRCDLDECTRTPVTPQPEQRGSPYGGEVSAIWRKRRWFCDYPACSKKTFSEATAQVPAYARSTGRATRGPGRGGHHLRAGGQRGRRRVLVS